MSNCGSWGDSNELEVIEKPRELIFTQHGMQELQHCSKVRQRCASDTFFILDESYLVLYLGFVT